MPLKKIVILVIALLIPSFVYFIMCPVAHSLTASTCQQLLIGQQPFQKNNIHHKEHTAAPLSNPACFSFNLQVYYKAAIHSLHTSFDQERANKPTLLKTTRLNL